MARLVGGPRTTIDEDPAIHGRTSPRKSQMGSCPIWKNAVYCTSGSVSEALPYLAKLPPCGIWRHSCAAIPGSRRVLPHMVRLMSCPAPIKELQSAFVAHKFTIFCNSADKFQPKKNGSCIPNCTHRQHKRTYSNKSTKHTHWHSSKRDIWFE